jgi:hypothetical protein
MRIRLSFVLLLISGGVTATPLFASTATAVHTQVFSATATYSDQSTQDITATATWSTSDAQLATINASGVATARRWGSVTIRASVGSVAGSAQLTILPIVTSIAVTPSTLTIAHHATGSLGATATYSDNTTQDVTATATWEQLCEPHRHPERRNLSGDRKDHGDPRRGQRQCNGCRYEGRDVDRRDAVDLDHRSSRHRLTRVDRNSQKKESL